jgi:hypothetical protein
MTSGLIVLGDRIWLGTGIYVDPHVELGDDIQVASGSVIVAPVPAGHLVKCRMDDCACVTSVDGVDARKFSSGTRPAPLADTATTWALAILPAQIIFEYRE